MNAWTLFAIGLLLFGFDVARLNMTGVALLGALLMFVAFVQWGVLTRAFWVAEDPRFAEIEADLEAAGR